MNCNVNSDIVHQFEGCHGHNRFESRIEFFRCGVTGFQDLGKKNTSSLVDTVINKTGRIFLDNNRNLFNLFSNLIADRN